MALPALVQAGAGATITGASGTPSMSGVTVGNVVVLQVLVDTNNVALPAFGTVTGIEDLNGSAGAMTRGDGSGVGSPAAGAMTPAFGRATATTVSVIVNTPGSGEDIYCRLYEFSGVRTDNGATTSAICENGADSNGLVIGAGTGTAISDVAVTTNGADRLAVNLIGVNDDNVVDAFTGMTGGTWVEPVAEYKDATGTDGCIAIMTADMASAGTIDGGTYTMAASDGWGVIGFAFIPGASGSTYTKTGFAKESA
jgi:hypothetical protein